MVNEIELLKKYIAVTLRKFRAEKHITQEELADISGVNIGTITRYESGTIMQSLDKLSAILKNYNVNLYIFFKEVYENMYRLENEKEG